MSSNEQLRRMTADDCIEYKSKLAEFYKKNIDSCLYIENFTMDDAMIKIDSLIEHVSKDQAIVYGYYFDKFLIGYVWAYEHKYRDEERVYVSEIRVDENFRGRGIGHKLLQAVENAALELGYRALYIHTEASNKGAIRLYENEGYEIERVQLRKQL